MIKIRRPTVFDYPKLKRLISYLSSDDGEPAKSLAGVTSGIINAVLPLSMKFEPESFILVNKNEIHGLVTIETTHGNPYKINITRLIFKENEYKIGQMLVDFIVQKYGAKGANTFCVKVDESAGELFDLFINGCGFRQCGVETLWKIEPKFDSGCLSDDFRFRFAQNSDAENIAALFNDELDSIFKPSMIRYPKEFHESFFVSKNYKNRYIIENDVSVLCYFSITTNDNLNYIFDITSNSAYGFDYEKIINKMLSIISNSHRTFYPFIKQKKYLKESESLEQYLLSKSYKPIQNQQILVKDFYKPVTQESSESWKIFMQNEDVSAYCKDSVIYECKTEH